MFVFIVGIKVFLLKKYFLYMILVYFDVLKLKINLKNIIFIHY
jgi:hypothetical protein